MMIYHASRHICVQPLEWRQTLRVHQDDAFDGPVWELISLDKGQLITVEGQEAAQVTVGAARKHSERFGVELRGPQERG